ncbi:hypothetical protein [Rhodococcus opacus]|uniref:hypothetical protein n=1 Tax=Rhodococcus opacus TaxID=37919 RepID=UPI001C476AE5|nr:hypothetical protein [Rhodococcus opacus]MBV6760415.1 hypothetical protein [Rhodococcus opacus]
MTEPLPQPAFRAPWSSEILSWSVARGRLLLRRGETKSTTVELQRCASGRLRHSYPVSARDIEVRLVDPGGSAELTTALRAVVAAIRDAEPQCRKVVYAVESGGSKQGRVGTLATIAAAEAAGFRYVVDVDVADHELSLLVSEPDWVTAVDIDLDHVPGS